MLAALRARRTIAAPVALVVAHPDDETIAAGGSLHLMPDLLLVHVTDGAPRRLGDAQAAGFASAEAYGQARAAELQSALSLCGTTPRQVALGVPDQDASLQMDAVADRLARLFAQHGIAAVLTHAYEGGHPDHDATALAVHRAAAGGPAVIEFAGYHAAPDGRMVTCAFLGPQDGTCIELPPADAARKSGMLDCFRTQSGILAQFSRTRECFRPAPSYDFTAPPHPGRLNYEHWGWEMTGAAWRRLAAASLGRPCAA